MSAMGNKETSYLEDFLLAMGDLEDDTPAETNVIELRAWLDSANRALGKRGG